MKTFLVSRTDAIGDVVLTLPLCGQLKKMNLGCRIILLGRTYTQAVAEACPWVDAFINYDELKKLGGQEQLAMLRQQQADVMLHVFPDKHLAYLARKAGIPLRVGTRNRWFHWLTCNRLAALSRQHSPLHEAQLNLKLLQPLGYQEQPSLAQLSELARLQPAVPLAAEWQKLLAARRPEQLNIILHPRSRGSAREWGLDHFGKLAHLLHQAGHRVFVSGTEQEGEELRPWLNAHAAVLAGELMGKLSLAQFLAFIAAADGLVAASTGPLHLAAALGRHALGLYPPMRPTHPGRWAPLGPHAAFLVFDQPDCEDCRREPASCTCIKAITPLQVLDQVLAWQCLPVATFAV